MQNSKCIVTIGSFFACCLIILFLSTVLGCGGNPAVTKGKTQSSTRNIPPGLPTEKYPEDITPKKKHNTEIRYISYLISGYHLTNPKIDDVLSKTMFDAYLKALDPEKFYFTQENIKDFSVYQTAMDDIVKLGVLRPLYQIHAVANRRAKQRFDYSKELLNSNLIDAGAPARLLGGPKVDWLADESTLRAQWVLTAQNDIYELKAIGKSRKNIQRILENRYTRALEELNQVSPDDVFSLIANSLTSIIDSSSTYYSPPDRDISVNLELVGIGLVLKSNGLFIEVSSVVENGPADKAGNIKVGDRIIKIGDEGRSSTEIIGWRLDNAVEKMRGKKGSVVELAILRNDQPKPISVKVVRDTVELKQLELNTFLVERDGKSIGVIGIPKFYADHAAQVRGVEDYRSVSRDLKLSIEQLEESGVDGLVIDLRGMEVVR